MIYRDPMGVELKVGQKVVHLSEGVLSHEFYLQVSTIQKIWANGKITATGLGGGTKTLDHLEIYVVGLDK